jgi:hypothetical protein
MLKVTFDTNTFDKAVRPHVYAKDPKQNIFAKIHDAIRDGRVAGFICETMITLEGIKVDNRAEVFGSTTLTSQMSVEGPDTIRVNMTAEQPLRGALHPKQSERFVAAFNFGFKLLGAPRIAMPRVEFPSVDPYATETDEELPKRLDRYFEVAQAIQNRGLGIVRTQQLATRLAQTAGATSPWFQVLGQAKDIHEVREVARAVSEWADADSIAAHYGYGNDLFCTLDEARPGHPSVLDPSNKAWLSATYDIQFADLCDLAASL